MTLHPSTPPGVELDDAHDDEAAVREIKRWLNTEPKLFCDCGARITVRNNIILCKECGYGATISVASKAERVD